MRHSHASLLIKKGFPITYISKRLGHATPNITLGVYSHFYKEDKDNVIDLLNNL
ncbi:tyrosine-type recombinase/integrase [Streptobacillus moniliformis]|uniref:tyrosine-type recombinase/integrase n=1 Tax=Streptobacillus moniliformis TaxID=34105 RepID=UPI0009BEA011|nr:tyrosine-type recombinase/integrase [Streptobacillus moniliformis]